MVAIPPLSISVAVEGTSSIDDCCTARGMTPLQLDDGSIYWQVCYFCTNAVETIISPQAIVDSSDVFQLWHQTGYRCGVSTPGCIQFDSHDGLLTMSMTLSSMMGSIIVLRMFMPLTTCQLHASHRLFGGLPVPHLCGYLVKVVLTNGSSLLPKQNRLNQRCGFFVLALPVFINLTCYPVGSLVYLRISDITRSTTSTTRNKRR